MLYPNSMEECIVASLFRLFLIFFLSLILSWSQSYLVCSVFWFLFTCVAVLLYESKLIVVHVNKFLACLVGTFDFSLTWTPKNDDFHAKNFLEDTPIPFFYENCGNCIGLTPRYIRPATDSSCMESNIPSEFMSAPWSRLLNKWNGLYYSSHTSFDLYYFLQCDFKNYSLLIMLTIFGFVTFALSSYFSPSHLLPFNRYVLMFW